MSPITPVLPAPPVSTTDALKALALALILVDHIGHFLADGWPAFRVVGRLGVPIFFFLIGFASTRDVPWRWLLLGAVLTGVDYLWVGSLGKLQLNILFNFALIRLALPLAERHLKAELWPVGLVIAGLVAMLPLTNPWLEYGTEGWLFALFGFLHRKVIAEGQRWVPARDLAWVASFAIYLFVERRDYNFSPLMTLVLAGGLLVLAAMLRHFRRGDLPLQPPPAIGSALRFCGRHSLEIYAAQIIVLAAIGGLVGLADWNMGEDADD